MRTFVITTYAQVSEVAALCLVLSRAGYEVAVESSGSLQARLGVAHPSEVALRAVGAALESCACIESEDLVS